MATEEKLNKTYLTALWNGLNGTTTSSLPPAEVAARIRQWREKTAEIEALKQRRQAASEKIKSRWTSSRRLLAKSQVGEGKSVPFAETVSVQRGELLLLTVLPNGNHGADSTLVEWTIRETAGDQRTWSLADLIPNLLKGNSWPDKHECTMELS